MILSVPEGIPSRVILVLAEARVRLLGRQQNIG